ncbi:MAG: NAD(P)H-binding protein [Ginsengibacter sp.]
MNEFTAVIIGATGLTGNLVVEELLKDDHFKTVRVLARRNVNIIHPKLEQKIVDFTNFDDYTKKFGEGDVIFCCIGTTQKKVKGDKNLYKQIDYDIPVNAAQIGISKGYKKFLIVSAIGANENSSNFYLQLKGKTENALKQFHFESLDIFQPSVLNGNRKETRIGEEVIQAILDIISFLFLGPLKKYHAIGADNVARAMVYASKQKRHNVHYYTYKEMMEMAREYIASKE